ncbi:MAG: osmoprotectant transport system ATP-binding protein [Limimaricola cinnabarinus]|jgi:osmoprotectant transport system ATP-binding protein|uniref:ABC transporter ATP-binding protein n=1 Tax=Limimaricola cinnabarinus TaxID=1125964 RepID=UPI0039E31E5F
MIRVTGLTKRFDGATAVNSLDFEVERGEVLALVGTSGCGKSTTLRMLNRLIEPDEGRIEIDGHDAREVSPDALRRGIGYVIQGVGLFPHWTVAQNIGTVPRLLRWDRARVRARVEELLDLFGLEASEYADKYPSELSGGQQQRVGVARAMAAEPAMLLMDEPFGALDPVTRGRLQDEFTAIRQRRGITAILVTHDMDEAFRLADRIAVMDAGQILQIDTPERLLRGPREGFVRQFVGLDDRALRILSLHRVSDLSRPAADAPAPAQWVAPGDTLREAASRLIWEAGDSLAVVENGRVTAEIHAADIWRIGARGEA